MEGSPTPPRYSNLTVICRECRKEFRGAEVRRHTELEGHEVFDLKPAAFPKTEGQNEPGELRLACWL